MVISEDVVVISEEEVVSSEDVVVSSEDSMGLVSVEGTVEDATELTGFAPLLT